MYECKLYPNPALQAVHLISPQLRPPSDMAAATAPSADSTQYQIHFLRRCSCHGNKKIPLLSHTKQKAAGKGAEDLIDKDVLKKRE